MQDQAVALRTLNAFAWLRQNAWFRRVYGLLPASFRVRLTARVERRAHASLEFVRGPQWSLAAVPAPAALAQDPRAGLPGVNIFGYLRGEFGLAESARLYAQALMAAGVPVALIDIDLQLPHGMNDDTFKGRLAQDAPHAVNLIFVNPDFLDAALEKIGEHRLRGRRQVACWFWELPELPASWRPAIERVDAIVVASDFVEQAFRRATDKPVWRVPLPYLPARSSGLKREDFGLEAEPFHFLCMFDFHSSIARKNPFAAIDAFQRAFPERQDVRLLIKTSNGKFHATELRELLARVVDDARILVRDDILERPHLHALFQCSDAFVSLHRAEGFGLVIAEMMGLGRPVVATGWSGNMEFMSPDNSCSVDYRLREITAGEYQDAAGNLWAEPDLAHAADLMRRLVEAPDFARDLGERAKSSVQTNLDPHNLGCKLARHLLGAQWMGAAS